jgi:KDO2-lipid IV(A) lauroyltransferase
VSRLTRCTPEDIRRRVRYETGLGLEHYHRARQTGLGVLFLTAHISAWELLPSAHSVLGHPLRFVVRPLDNLYLDQWVTGLRSRFGNQVISKFGSLRDIFRSLRNGEDVGLLIDQNVQEKDGVFAPLFGRPAATTAAAAMLALKTGAQVVMGFIVPEDLRGHYRIRFYPPLTAESSGDRELDVVRNTAIYNAHIEQVLREFPHNWLWGHRRFRTQPDGSNPYEA